MRCHFFNFIITLFINYLTTSLKEILITRYLYATSDPGFNGNRPPPPFWITGNLSVLTGPASNSAPPELIHRQRFPIRPGPSPEHIYLTQSSKNSPGSSAGIPTRITRDIQQALCAYPANFPGDADAEIKIGADVSFRDATKRNYKIRRPVIQKLCVSGSLFRCSGGVVRPSGRAVSLV